jgi:hypothetical protein
MEKTPDDILQQEILRERAEVLSRAGHSVEQALIKLRLLEESIEGQCRDLHRTGHSPAISREIKEINSKINRYNRLREYAQLRYHYLIITREAIGLRRHHRVEEIYPIPPKKRHLQEI